MCISSEQLIKLQKKIIKKVSKKTGETPTETGSRTRFDGLSGIKREAIMKVAKRVCKKFAEKHILRYNECSTGKFFRVGGVTVVGIYQDGERITVFDY